MKAPAKAVKKLITKARNSTADAVAQLIKYGVFQPDEIDEAIKVVNSKDTWVIPSKLSFYYDQIENDIIAGRETENIIKIREIIKNHYGLNDDEKEPENLDDLLNEIRQSQESKEPSGSLTLYEGTRETDLVDEEIDETILRLLGLEDVFDIDYKTYLTLLRERLAASRMPGSQIPSEEDEIIREEFKRVKGKTGRFKIKTKKVDIKTTPIGKAKAFLTGEDIKVNVKEERKYERKVDDLTIIKKTVLSIYETLQKRNEMLRKASERERILKEREKRRKKEEKLETVVGGVKKIASKILSPVKSILDRIIDFIVYTLLGKALYNLIGWFADKENKSKVDNIFKFLNDWWPAILGAFILFGTSFGSFVRGFIGTVAKLTLRLAKFAIPKLLRFTANNPVAAALIAGGALAAGGAYVASQQNERRREEESKTDPTVVTPKQTAETGKTPPPSQLQQEYIQQRGLPMFRNGGILKGIQNYNPPLVKYTEGGEIERVEEITQNSGEKITGAGPDTQLIAAQPGEIVINRKTVQTMGPEFFLGLNRMYGGSSANTPMFSDNVQLARNGGIVGGIPYKQKNYNIAAVYGSSDPEYMKQQKLKQFMKGLPAGSGFQGRYDQYGREYNVNTGLPIKTLAGGGMITKAAKNIKDDEGLSSLTPGKNDYIKPGGVSVRSNIPWENIKPNTPIHAYQTGVSRDRTTIGWGSTFYDNILNGKKPVRPGDVITKQRADKILNDNILKLSKTYSEQMKYWEKMSDSQKAGVLSIGYNAPYGPIGVYPKLTSALQNGDMISAAQNAYRDGPSKHRINTEKRLLLSGYTQLRNLVGPKIVGPKEVGSGIPLVPDLTLKKMMGLQGGGMVQKLQGGGIAGMLSGLGIGRVMAPKGPQWKGQGTSVYKVGPITIPGSEQKGTYTPQDIQRFNKLHPTRNITEYSAKRRDSLSDTYGDYMSSATETVPKGKPSKPSNGQMNREKVRGAYKDIMNAPGFESYRGLMQKALDTSDRMNEIRMQQNEAVKALGRAGGGPINENTGSDIPGGTADRQLAALQPGEYVLPVDTVTRLGKDNIDRIVAATDNNSNPAKLGKRSSSITIPGPRMRNRGSQTITLPPIKQGGDSNIASVGTVKNIVPSLPITTNPTRERNKSIFGLNLEG